MTKETTDAKFSSDVLNSQTLVLVDFWAPWCGPCRQLSPTIDEISKDCEGKIEVFKCNVDENPEAPSKYGVRGIPSLMLFKGGKLIDSKVGASPKAILVEWINKHL
ncbi:MAG: thioredoxin [Proteobacteria bacterium]|nr:thioredoxin [Pseudomonadota bacterium]NCA28108.1 thioredoxin [Pseudomonadota bacterium]